MKSYVNGLLFSRDGKHVTLIKKKKFPPNQDWSANPFNGIGGKIEGVELPIEAMIREFHEEAGVLTTRKDWKMFALLHCEDWSMFLFRAFNDEYQREARTMEIEPVGLYPVNNLPAVMKNLKWMIPLALDRHVNYAEMQHVNDTRKAA